jgi:hypothetical protein
MHCRQYLIFLLFTQVPFYRQLIMIINYNMIFINSISIIYVSKVRFIVTFECQKDSYELKINRERAYTAYEL